MTVAVRGWSPVIMIGRMPAPRALATATRRLRARWIDHADQPREGEILLEPLASGGTVSGERIGRDGAEGHTEGPQRLVGERLVGAQDLGRGAPASAGATDLARQAPAYTARAARRARPS